MNEEHPAVERLLLFQELQAERDEILRHKWIASEAAGRDIGFDKALLDWIIKHRAAWHAWRKEHAAGAVEDAPGVCPSV